MSTTPTWDPAVAGTTALAAQVNQLLSAHAAQIIYQGNSQVSDTTPGSGGDSTYNLSLAQQFVLPAGQTTITRIELFQFYTGSNVNLSISIQTDSGGLPSGTIVSSLSVTVPSILGSTTPGDWYTIPIPLTGLTAGIPYWIVMASTTSALNYVTWDYSSATSGAATKSGASWVAQTYGYMFNIFNGSNAGDVVRNTFEDGGDRWTAWYWGSGDPWDSGLLSYYQEVIGTSQWSDRNLVYDANNNLLMVT